MCTPPDDPGPRAAPASREEERRLRAGDGASLREFVALPPTGFRRGAVLIIFDIWGYTDFYKDLARRITERGHAAVLVDFFGRQGDLPAVMQAPERTGRKPDHLARAMKRAQQLRDERFLADLQAAVDDLHARGAAQVAVWGFCWGGRYAYVSAAGITGLAGVVAYYGPLQPERGRLSPLALAPEIRIPVLGVFGGADPGIPADQIAAFEHAVPGDKEFVTYPGAPHGFLRYDPSEHQAAVDDALARTFRFLGRVLTPS
ncbi:MAG TPA: dienelactone hydrolase family protein [Candidatus Dormibacteraeota bacterium]|nr:dienelactone hydrolase family protein [Candidatus Dormibacteraeota bacterium]